MLSSSSAYLRASFQRYFCSFRPPPSFKEVTPSCRTNMRQLLLREQCLQREQKLGHSNKQQPSTASSSSRSKTSNSSQHEMTTGTIAITGEVLPSPCSIEEVSGQQQWMAIDRESSLHAGGSSLYSEAAALPGTTSSSSVSRTSNVVKAKTFSWELWLLRTMCYVGHRL